MGMMINGEWIDDDAAYRADGTFLRAASAFDGRISADGKSDFVAESGRYHLLASAACPWAHRALIVRRLKKLEHVISVTYADLPTKRSWDLSVVRSL